MKFIRGHNSVGMDRSKPYKTHYIEEDRGYDTPCWIWQLETVKPGRRTTGGYGKMGIKGKYWLAHRWYYERSKGPIPEGLQLDHLCEVRACVNPDHLEPVTPLVNTRRSRSMKISYEQSKEILALTETGMSNAAIGRQYDVSAETVRLIKLNGVDKPRRG